ncbi:hypothetical protein J1605_009208 [Eschrichtius robustus]|uniref:E3 ubiquitin-protein transferase MAEA n=2 Tax=Mysticeti TaxID=9761 RepID=A0AB34GVU6_ESCRO|nr:hypothetical protein J1605_009208 [Eschrichtius robustus]
MARARRGAGLVQVQGTPLGDGRVRSHQERGWGRVWATGGGGTLAATTTTTGRAVPWFRSRTVDVPYETLNKRFRAAQKNIDRETSHVTMVVAELEKTLSSCPAVDSVVSLLDGVVEKLSVLKRKAVESIQAEDESAKLCKRRIEHLKEHSSDQPAAASVWKRKRMDRMMVEHLLRCGYYNTAVKLARQSGIEVGAGLRVPRATGFPALRGGSTRPFVRPEPGGPLPPVTALGARPVTVLLGVTPFSGVRHVFHLSVCGGPGGAAPGSSLELRVPRAQAPAVDGRATGLSSPHIPGPARPSAAGVRLHSRVPPPLPLRGRGHAHLRWRDLVNIEMFLTAKEVEESLERRETATCLAWCHDNKSRLRKMKGRQSEHDAKTGRKSRVASGSPKESEDLGLTAAWLQSRLAVEGAPCGWGLPAGEAGGRGGRALADLQEPGRCVCAVTRRPLRCRRPTLFLARGAACRPSLPSPAWPQGRTRGHIWPRLRWEGPGPSPSEPRKPQLRIEIAVSVAALATRSGCRCSCLEFSLRIQEFIELIRQNKRLDAVRHARKHFSQAEGSQLDEVRQVMGMLAFPPDTHISPYKSSVGPLADPAPAAQSVWRRPSGGGWKLLALTELTPSKVFGNDLLDPARWRMLIQQFRYDNYRLHQLGNNSVFTLTLQAGLSAIKTPYPSRWEWLPVQCYKEDGSSRSPDCPVCSRSLNKLAQPLPMAHCANSRLVCKISGDVMNENNPPMMLPNGYVYGYNSLLSIRQDDKVVCPRTKEVFHFSQAEKVYIM